MEISPNNIACIFVLYYPQSDIERHIEHLLIAGYPIVLVSNGTSIEILDRLSKNSNVHVLVNDCNLGLATALNQGMAYAFDLLKTLYVALFDQDSSPDFALPLGLAKELVDCGDPMVACYGPRLIDEKKPLADYPQFTSFFSLSQPGSIPTSGTVISKSSWRAVGPMLDQLFIDGIDHEWCFRACSRGLSVRRSKSLTMKHNMGDIGFNLFGTYKPIHRSPFRHYFIVRNSIYLSTLSYIPFGWRIVELLKTLRRIFVYSIVSTNTSQSIKLMTKAVCHGICRKLGPLKGPM